MLHAAVWCSASTSNLEAIWSGSDSDASNRAAVELLKQALKVPVEPEQVRGRGGGAPRSLSNASQPHGPFLGAGILLTWSRRLNLSGDYLEIGAGGEKTPES